MGIRLYQTYYIIRVLRSLCCLKCTKKFLDQLKINNAASMEGEPLFSWHANFIKLNGKKTIVIVNHKNRYNIVLYGLKAKDFKALDKLILEALKKTFKAKCMKVEVIEKYINHLGEFIYGKTKNGSLVSRMNNFCELVYLLENLYEII